MANLLSSLGSSITNLPVAENNRSYHSYGKGNIVDGRKIIIIKGKRLFIRRDITEIHNYSFNTSKLVYVSIPNSVEIIGERAFNSCEFLKYVKFEPNSRLKIIDTYAFNRPFT